MNSLPRVGVSGDLHVPTLNHRTCPLFLLVRTSAGFSGMIASNIVLSDDSVKKISLAAGPILSLRGVEILPDAFSRGIYDDGQFA